MELFLIMVQGRVHIADALPQPLEAIRMLYFEMPTNYLH